jgi:RNA-dependent RNA polymerase
MTKIDFASRVLMEGLIAHGIIKPADVPVLWEALKVHAVVPAFRQRILESLYSSDRIRNVASVVRSESTTRNEREGSGVEGI